VSDYRQLRQDLAEMTALHRKWGGLSITRREERVFWDLFPRVRREILKVIDKEPDAPSSVFRIGSVLRSLVNHERPDGHTVREGHHYIVTDVDSNGNPRLHSDKRTNLIGWPVEWFILAHDR
jgi:hypothetical protein